MKLKISKSVKEDSEDEEFYPEEESQNSQHSQNSASTATEQSESQDAATTTATITRPATRATRSSVLVSTNIVQFSIHWITATFKLSMKTNTYFWHPTKNINAIEIKKIHLKKWLAGLNNYYFKKVFL